MKRKPDMNQTITIGELSQLTGISPHTLRVWEKRYGSPVALRLPSGHRRYPPDEVPRLRAVARALEAGYRAGRVVGENLEKLETLLHSETPPADLQREPSDPGSLDLSAWFQAAFHYDEAALSHLFYREWDHRGPLAFIKECGVPFMVGIGDRWEAGTLSVAQEHFASERLSDFLAAQWRRLNERNTRGPFVLTSLPGEAHRVGLQMAAVVTALADKRVIYLGPDTPIGDIVSTVERSRADTVVISISSSMGPRQPGRKLTSLRDKLPKKTRLVTGGAGAPEAGPGITRFTNFDAYYLWLRQTP